MDDKLTSQDIIKLINLYRSHPLLWDVTNKGYKRSDLRFKAYEAIAKEMGMTVELAKKNIISLRATYLCEMRKIALPWFNELSFLNNYIYKTKSNDIVDKNALNSDDETIATSTSIGLNIITTGPEDECTTKAEPIKAKEKFLEYNNDLKNLDIMEPTKTIKEEIIDDEEIVDEYCEDFIDISDDTAAKSKIQNCPPVIYQQIKLEPEICIDEKGCVTYKEDDCDETQEVNGYSSPSIDEETKQTIDDETEVFQNFEIAGGEKETKKRLWDFDKNLTVSSKKIKKEPNELHGKENQIKIETLDNLTNISESELSAAKNHAADVEEEDMPVELEIEDCDDELIEIINNYTKTTPESSEQENLLTIKTEIKEEPLEEIQSDGDGLTVIEIISDDDNDYDDDDEDCDDGNNIEPVIMLNEQPVVNLENTSNEMQDNLPSTSQSAIAFSLPTTSSLVTKEEYATKLTIKSKVEAFKYLHCIKKFFQSQNDEEAYKIITRLMMTFMICSEQKEAS